MIWWLILAAFGGSLVGYAFGYSRRAEKVAQTASNLAISVVATTAELTYGDEWFQDFIDEANTVMKEYPDLIITKFRAVELTQKRRELDEKVKQFERLKRRGL